MRRLRLHVAAMRRLAPCHDAISDPMGQPTMPPRCLLIQLARIAAPKPHVSVHSSRRQPSAVTRLFPPSMPAAGPRLARPAAFTPSITLREAHTRRRPPCNHQSSRRDWSPPFLRVNRLPACRERRPNALRPLVKLWVRNRDFPPLTTKRSVPLDLTLRHESSRAHGVRTLLPPAQRTCPRRASRSFSANIVRRAVGSDLRSRGRSSCPMKHEGGRAWLSDRPRDSRI
ncbi:hypothetical protein BU16DRAFT_331609 [Lophium mytilinum]|uniref:Uncharacterized protein n=1 Tax=Lophium mytilinum TaxID=390894 RepID=A0A6A6R0H0_9PEZI|nr:hypothetical protein BU16DRAFT_331609 [Lophium mytilinum]